MEYCKIRPKISIIVPIYNTEKFVGECIKSLLDQTLKEIEIILIDDGSTDESLSICKKFKYDERIKIIYKNNEGVSIARNLGITIAKGEFIGFIDSDDIIEREMFEKLYESAKKNKSQIVISDVKILNGKKCVIDTFKELKYSCRINQPIEPILFMQMAGSMWRCIYKRELIINNNIKCPSKMKLSEDRIFNILAFGQAENIYYLKEPLYIQKVRVGSATNSYQNNMIQMLIEVRNETIKSLDLVIENSEKYKKKYEQQHYNFINQCITNELNNKISFNLKYKKVKEILNNEIIDEILKENNQKTIKDKIIKSKNILFIIFLFYIKKIIFFENWR